MVRNGAFYCLCICKWRIIISHFISQKLHSVTLRSQRDHYRFVCLTTGLQVPVASEQTQNRLNQIKSVMKTRLSPQNNQWDTLFGASGRRPESRTCEQDSHKQTALPKVTRSLFWHRASLNTECQGRGEEKEEREEGGHRGKETEACLTRL